MENPMHIRHALWTEAAARLGSQPAFVQPVSLGFHDIDCPHRPEVARPPAGDHVLSDDLGVIHARLWRDTGIHVVTKPALEEGPDSLVCRLDERFVSPLLNESRQLALRRALGTGE